MSQNIHQSQTCSAPVLGAPFGRIPVTKVSPVLEGGAYPAKATIGEEIPIKARVFREGHDAVAASAILTSPSGRIQRYDMAQIWPFGLDIWQVLVRLDEEGEWTFRVEGWNDRWHTWRHHAEAKLPHGIDVRLVCLEGQQLMAQASQAAAGNLAADLIDAAAIDLDPEVPVSGLLETLKDPCLDAAMKQFLPRDLVSPSPEYRIFCDRKRALFSSWYEFFPRSQGAYFDEQTQQWVSGTFDSSHRALEHAAAMGFDVVYLPPIHPIGTTFRKGKNNSLEAGVDQPGSPWAIGSPAGGHDAIHPDLGDEQAFDRFISRAHELGLEVALDLALQASPDHPWVQDNPQWFTTRADGTIAYAENPPKKYQDIYPINFDNDPDGLATEILRIVKLWITRGVTIFRVDNPHTKPISFWDWLLTNVRRTNPEVLFLAEAFTRPEMMHTLGKIGFHQSYTYFTWRNNKAELTEYLTELSRETDAFYRPNFWPNTPDINPAFLQSGLPAAFAIRIALAATLSPSWGMYSGLELAEHAVFRAEEYLDSEKYEYRPRDLSSGELVGWITLINQIRRRHSALQQLRTIDFHHTDNDAVIAFSKRDGDDVILVVCSLNPDDYVSAAVELNMTALGQPGAHSVQAYDEVSGEQWLWGNRIQVFLSPARPCHICVVTR
ncbi:MAG: maltotransferase domain-containing protein [Propionibacteriaceae bacterium]